MSMQPYEAPAYQSTDSWVPVVAAVGDLANKISGTEFVGKGFRGKPASTAAAILTGRELGLGPMASLRGLQVIDGSVSMTAQMMAGKILAAGHQVQWVESSDKAAEVRITRRDGLGEATARFTLADAQRADLLGKTNWKKYPRAMLRARALSECAGMVCADVILGLEAADTEPQEGPSQPPGVSVVQLAGPAPEPAAAAPASAITAPAPVTEQRADEPPADVSTEPAEPLGPEPITPPQMRKISAQIRELERLDERKFSREERREFIGTLVGIDNLGSANDLTKEEASRAIEELARIIGDAMERAEAEPAVDTETGEIQGPEGVQA